MKNAAKAVFLLTAAVISLSVMPSAYAQDNKTLKTDSHISSEKPVSEKVEKKETSPEPLMDIDREKLSDSDFSIGRIHLGDSFSSAVQTKGTPEKILRTSVKEEYGWKGMSISGTLPYLSAYSGRKDLPRSFLLPKEGISSIFVKEGKSPTARGISIGSSRENLLRRYGRPEQILWDGKDKVFYFRYRLDRKKLSFTVKDNKVSAISMDADPQNRPTPASYRMVSGKSFLEDRDFHVAGYELGAPFAAHPFEEWEKKMTNPREEIWYYSGYAVRLTAKEKLISALFLQDSRMTTSRGLALGDDLSTVEFLYGKPHRIEMDVSGSEPRTSYIYFSKGKRQVLIIGIAKNKVERVVSMVNPTHKVEVL